MKIICVGKNYALHAAELNSSVPKEPLIFLKPDSALLRKNMPFFIPDFSNEIHHEVEVVIKINRVGKCIEEEFAHRYYSEFALGIDFTARDIQNEFRKNGFPWELCKGFDGAAFVSEFHPIADHDLGNLNFSLERNATLVQKGNTKDMAFGFDCIVSFVSRYFTLKKGDLIFTGTPEGVGKVISRDKLTGYIEGQSVFNLKIK